MCSLLNDNRFDGDWLFFIHKDTTAKKGLPAVTHQTDPDTPIKDLRIYTRRVMTRIHECNNDQLTCVHHITTHTGVSIIEV